MADSIQVQIEQLRTAIEKLESQRKILGDTVVNTSLAALQQQLSTLEEKAVMEEAPVEERRMVTILFMDMVGSTSLAEKLDPEEWRQVIKKFHSAVGQAVVARHGNIAQYLGDGLLAFFGAKEASENDPEQAVRAALDGQAAVAELPLTQKVQLRAGIHTGLVVVGELGTEVHKEFTASGDAVNLAARLQSAAPVGGILISYDTYRYVRGVFDLTPQPPLTVKGKSESLQTYLVRRAKPRPFRSVARGVAGVETRTVGREAEIQALQQAYLRAYEGHGMVWAQLVGDPGIGKSRLLEDMQEWLELRPETFRLLRARAFPDDAGQPFALVRRLWFDRFQIAEDMPLEQAQAKWVERFREFSGLEECEERAHALGLLVGLPFKDSPHVKGMRNDPTQVKGRAVVVSREVLRLVRGQYPVVVLLEDLQWADATSWEYLVDVFLGGETEALPNGMFILAAARSEWRPPQGLVELFKGSSGDLSDSQRWGLQITLAPLMDKDIYNLVEEIFQCVEAVPEEVVQLVVDRSEGVPYFTEELVNWFVDHDILDTREEPWRFHSEKLKEQPLPATLQHLLLTRLGSLSQPERAVLQRGAIFGRRFWAGGVEALGAPDSPETLAHLQPRGFVEAQPESTFEGDSEWNFHHNLLQEVTYESVLKRERAALHKIAAGWLEAQARQSGRLDEFAALLGEHCEKAGELSAAVDWYLQAGSSAYKRGAPREAAGFYSCALDLLPPVDKQRRWHALKGREQALSVLGEAEPWKVDVSALVELAQVLDDDNLLAEAYLCQAVCGMRTGDEQLGEQAARQALEIARRCGNEAIEAKALGWVAVACVDKGDYPGTFQAADASLQLARRMEDEQVLSYVLARAAFAYGGTPLLNKVRSLNNEQIELDHHLGNRLEEALGRGNQGCLYFVYGFFKQGRELVEQAIQIARDLGSNRILAYNLSTLGAIYYYTGDLRKARQLQEEALQLISPTNDARGIASILFVLGHVLLAMRDFSGAARRFAEARQTALSKEIAGQTYNAEIGLAACAFQQGQLDEARDYMHHAWDYLKSQGWLMMDNPMLACRMGTDIFEALGEEENALAFLESGYRALMEVADQESDPVWRKSLLEDFPDSRAVVELWESRKK